MIIRVSLVILLCLLLIIPMIRSLYIIDTLPTEYNILIECVEDYSIVGGTDLKYVCDAAVSFRNKLYDTGKYDYWYYSDSLAWPSDWWTKEVSGYSNYPIYHAYRQDYAVFLGHGNEGRFIFGIMKTASNGYDYSEVWLVSKGPNGYTWMYPYDDNYDEVYTRWITLFASQVLNADAYPNMGYSISDVFYYTFTNQGSSPACLHGIVGARTEMVDYYKPCTICSEVPASVNTMNDYADRLISGSSITDAWFNAVWTYNNVKDIFGNIVFQTSPAALYYIVQFKDSQGRIIASYDYKNEGMLGFSSTIYPAPFQLEPPPGTAQIVYVEVYLYG